MTGVLRPGPVAAAPMPKALPWAQAIAGMGGHAATLAADALPAAEWLGYF
ncbi:MAG: hypothetical protein WKG07_09490 [Hymenobacter sp.]